MPLAQMHFRRARFPSNGLRGCSRPVFLDAVLEHPGVHEQSEPLPLVEYQPEAHLSPVGGTRDECLHSPPSVSDSQAGRAPRFNCSTRLAWFRLPDQPALTAMRRGCACACLGIRSVSTPSFKFASILDVSSSRLSVKLRRQRGTRSSA